MSDCAVPMTAAGYRDALMNQVMPIWTANSPDREHGGFFHYLDREGHVFETKKNTWCQARHTWMFARLHRDMPSHGQWGELAQLGRDYLVEHCYAGEGRWHYATDQQGATTGEPRSWFAEAFGLIGLCEAAKALGDDRDRPIIEATFAQMVKGLREPASTTYHHFEMDMRYIWHGPWMVAAGAAPSLRHVLDAKAVDALAEEALQKILHVFARDQEEALFECLYPDGSPIDGELGQRINPGHALESMWFCLDEAQRRGDEALTARIAQVATWMFDKGWDEEFGGLLAFVDPQGQQPVGPEMMNDWGERWDDKVWWVHAEALVVAAWLTKLTGDAAWADRWKKLHDYTFAHFPDAQFGDWYEYLDRRTAKPRYEDKGKWIKCAFHIPRALLKTALILEH